MLIHDLDAGIAALHLGKLCAGETIHPDRAAHLGLVHVVAAFVQTAHGVQIVIQAQNVRGAIKTPVKADQAHTGVCRDLHQDLLGGDDGGVLHAKGHHAAVSRHLKLGELGLVDDREIRDGCRQVQLFQDTAPWQGDSHHRRAIQQDFFNVGAAAGVQLLGKPGAVPGVQSPQQGVVAKGQGHQVVVDVALCPVADFQVGQVLGVLNVDVFQHQGAEIAKRGDHRCTVHADDRVLRALCRPLKLIGPVAHHALLRPFCVEVDLTVHIDVAGQPDIALCVGAHHDAVFLVQRRAGLGPGVQVAEAIVHPVLEVLFLLALLHGKVLGIARLFQGLHGLAPGVLVIDGLTPLALMRRKRLVHLVIAQQHLTVRAHLGAQPPVFCLDLLGKAGTQVRPEDVVLAVEHGISGLGVVDVFHPILKGQVALVVRADGGVRVIEQPDPLGHIGNVGGEGVLLPLVDAEEDQGKQVVEDGVIHIAPAGNLGLELLQPGGLLFLGQAVRGGVGAGHPCHKLLQAGDIGVLIGVTALKGGLPAREVSALEAHQSVAVLLDLPALVAALEAKDLRRALVVVEVVLADELGAAAVIVEHHDGVALNGLAHSGVCHLRRCPNRTQLVVQFRKNHVVGTLAGGHICLVGKHHDGNSIVIHGVYLNLSAIRQGESVLELDLEVLDVVILGGCTLHVDLRPLKGEAALGMHRINVLAAAGLLVALIGGQHRAAQDHVALAGPQGGGQDLAVVIKDVVAVVPILLVSKILSVGDPVVQHLEAGQIAFVDADVVDVDGAVAGAKGDVHGNCLGEVIAVGILHHTGDNAVHVGQNQASSASLFDDKGETQVVIFLVVGGDHALLRSERRLLRRDLQAALPCPAGGDDRVIVQHAAAGKLDLNGLAGGAEVLGKHLHRDLHPGIAAHAERRNALLVLHPAVAGEVKAGQGSGHTAVLPFGGIGLVVAPTVAGEIETQIVGLGLHIDGCLGRSQLQSHAGHHGRTERNIRDNTAEGQSQFSCRFHTIAPRLFGAIHRHASGLTGLTGMQIHGCGKACRVIHDIRNSKSLELLHLRLPPVHRNDGRVVPALRADQHIVQVVGRNGLAVYFGGEVNLQAVRAVALGRNGKCLLSAGCGDGLCADLRAVHFEMHRFLRCRSGGVGKGDPSAVGHTAVKGGFQHQAHHRQVEAQAPAVSVNVRHIHLHSVAARAQILANVHGVLALGNLACVLHRAVHTDFQHAASGGHAVFQAAPGKGDLRRCALADGLVDPARRVGQGQHSVVALAASASATADTRNQQRIANRLAAACQINIFGFGILIPVIDLSINAGVDLVRVEGSCKLLCLSCRFLRIGCRRSGGVLAVLGI